jgi:hypothetical protein
VVRKTEGYTVAEIAADGQALAAPDPADLATGACVMSELSEAPGRTLPLSVVQWVNAVCNRFEQAWRAGQRPRIEDYVGDGWGFQRRRGRRTGVRIHGTPSGRSELSANVYLCTLPTTPVKKKRETA